MTAQVVSIPDWARPQDGEARTPDFSLPATLTAHDRIKFTVRYSHAIKSFGGEESISAAQLEEIRAGILENLDQDEAAVTAPAGLKLRRVTELELPPPTQWIGRGWLPRREITVVVGEEGIGKSLLWVLFAAHITTGHPFRPFNIPAREPADVVVIVTEDSAAEVNARLQAAGADLNHVVLFCAEEDGSGTPVFGEGMTGDMLLLHALLEEMDEPPAMLVVDAWLDTVSGKTNVKDTQQARAALHPWKQLADFHDLAVVLVTHTNRMDTANTRDLMGGTAALRQKARMVLFAARSKQDHEEDRQHLWVGPDKANSTSLSPAVKFELAIEQSRPPTQDDPGTTARLAHPQSALLTIRALLEQWRRTAQEEAKTPPRSVQAIDAIREYMAGRDHHTIPSAELKAHLRELTYGKTAIEEAMKAAGNSRPLGAGGPWYFTLHEDAPNPDFLGGQHVSGS